MPEYVRSLTGGYGRRMSSSVTETIRLFVDWIGGSDACLARIDEMYSEIGAFEAQNGRDLNRLQTAIRVSGQVACRRFIKDAYRLDWSVETLGLVTESLFVFLEAAATAAAEGFAGVHAEQATERERHRARLCALLVADPPADSDTINELAWAAGWAVPKTIAVVALPQLDGAGDLPVIPPAVLAYLEGPSPYLVVPDPDGPGQDRLVAAAVRGRTAAIGPTVPLADGAISVRWARHALSLVECGELGSGPRPADTGEPSLPGRRPADPMAAVVRCVDHIATLAASMSRDLIGAAAAGRLAPLFELPATRRDPLVRTLLAYMCSADNAVTAATMLHIHQQTVRYRVRRIEELCGPEIFDAERRLEIMIMLHAWTRFGITAQAELLAQRSAKTD